MSGNDAHQNHIELLQGTLNMLILQTLQWGPQHGHGVGQAIRQSSADLLQIERGSLYPPYIRHSIALKSRDSLHPSGRLRN